MNDYDLINKGDLSLTSTRSTLSPPKKSSPSPEVTSQDTNISKKVSIGKIVTTPKVINIDYNVVDDFKRMKYNITIYDLSNFVPQQ